MTKNLILTISKDNLKVIKSSDPDLIGKSANSALKSLIYQSRKNHGKSLL